LKDISTGKYNLVAIKQGWGFRYLYEIQIDKGDNEVATAITLYPELHISGDWNSDITVDTYNHLVVDGNTNLVPGTSFTIMPGAVVRINPGCDFKIFGDFSAQGEEGNMFWVTSNDGFNQQAVTSNQRLNELELYFLMELANISFVEDNLIEWGKWDWGNTCLMNGVNNLNMENSIFQNGSCGFHSLNVDLTNCSNLLARNCWGDNVGGLYYSNINDGFINYSIAFKCTNGSRVKDNFRGSINNNCFISNNNGIELWDMLGVVSHNEFDNLSKDIKLTGSTSPQTTNMVIELNNLNGNIGVYQFSNYSYGYYTLIILSYNNFFNNNLFILHNSGFCNTGNEYIIANDNYFKDCYTLDQVFEKIVQEHPNCDNRVLIESFFHNMLSEAGIEG
ncbi:MAG: hypothetical protein JW866_10260, partial [Ignavibacteriales bacterium]|nr:hypothetical protein [Ignavibacteriales bacterium]